MQILPVNSSNNSNHNKKAYKPSTIEYYGVDKPDCFESSLRPYMKKTPLDRFLEFLHIKRKLNIPQIENIFKDLKHQLCIPENVYNLGNFGTVYEIPESDLMIKVPHDPNDPNYRHEPLDMNDKLNGVIYKSDSYSVLKRIYGLDKSFARKAGCLDEFTVIAMNMPQSAYDDLLNTIGYIHSSQSYLDTVGDNMILDKNTLSFHPFDLTSGCMGSEYRVVDSDISPTKKQVDILCCMAQAIGVTHCPQYFNTFFARFLSSVANDFKYFPTTFIEPSSSVLSYYAQGDVSSEVNLLYEQLKAFQELKMNLYEQGYDEKKIKHQLKTELNNFQKRIDEFKAQDENQLSDDELLKMGYEVAAQIDEFKQSGKIKKYVSPVQSLFS